jgi:hypothetical protein
LAAAAHVPTSQEVVDATRTAGCMFSSWCADEQHTTDSRACRAAHLDAAMAVREALTATDVIALPLSRSTV